MEIYQEVQDKLRRVSHTWLVTGVAGFIGSNLLQRLLELDQQVVGIDNFATGHRKNLNDVRSCVGEERWRSFRFVEGDLRQIDTCTEACRGIDYVLHQAALGSVPRSIDDPLSTHQANVDGFVHLLIAARNANVRRVVYAGSSSTYGDNPALPKVEDKIGRPLSPYAVTKQVNELYARVFHRTYGLNTIGLRYFNVFGRRQDPNGAYAAVIPRWIGNMMQGRRCRINGDGETSRDFTFVDNVVQANLLAALTPDERVIGEVYNVACGERITLNQLYQAIHAELIEHRPTIDVREPEYTGFRPGDVRHSHASIEKAREHLGYSPTHTVTQGLRQTLCWYLEEHDWSLREQLTAR